ncbi:LysR substrate-binding domain-containing protein [Vibrio mexicanus]|uniref:LysR substrate-binding domain-containing protein n=1 Tax=Vibrio mexicanus TaxID=1004326 RepID=UPI00063CAFEF|nr:LysR substrate-binding domain-containing protein [Vibrio mexicanus]
MKERMPPLQGLYYFSTAAELKSFKLAADKLYVSAAAISQQIRVLEEFLDCALFIRRHRQVELTAEGQLLFEQTQRGFDHLRKGVQLINQDPNPNQLSISTLPSFAQHWLVPRIGDFRLQHPDLSLLLEPSNQLVNFQDSNVDLCIRYGLGDYKNLESRILMDEVVYPVCHPMYQRQHNIYHIEDLTRAELIEDMWPDMDWNLWLYAHGRKKTQTTLKYDGSHFVLEGALSVQGVALVKHSLAVRYIKEGKLVRIGDTALRPRYNYYLCAPSSYFKREKIKQFIEWLRREVALFQQANPAPCDVLETDFTLPWRNG